MNFDTEDISTEDRARIKAIFDEAFKTMMAINQSFAMVIPQLISDKVRLTKTIEDLHALVDSYYPELDENKQDRSAFLFYLSSSWACATLYQIREALKDEE